MYSVCSVEDVDTLYIHYTYTHPHTLHACTVLYVVYEDVCMYSVCSVEDVDTAVAAAATITTTTATTTTIKAAAAATTNSTFEKWVSFN